MRSVYLTIRNRPVVIFQISKLKINYQKIKDILLKINDTWIDVQNLNLLSHYLISHFEEIERDGFYGDNICNFLKTLAKDFYVHFSIIYKLLEKIKNETQDKNIGELFKDFKLEFKHKIQISRNLAIVHKEKQDFLDTQNSLFDTSCGGLFLKLYTKNGIFEIKPFIDAKRIENYLLKLKKIIED